MYWNTKEEADGIVVVTVDAAMGEVADCVDEGFPFPSALCFEVDDGNDSDDADELSI